MICFWITKIWEQRVLDTYETVMRLDSDSCFLKPSVAYSRNSQYLPGLPLSSLTTTANGIEIAPIYHTSAKFRDDISVSEGFGTFVHQYVSRHKIIVKNPKMFQEIPNESNQLSPALNNNFEVSNVGFMKDPEVKKFHEALTEQEPFGVFRYRWGDALERYATMAIFASEDMVVIEVPNGYHHASGKCHVFDNKAG